MLVTACRLGPYTIPSQMIYSDLFLNQTHPTHTHTHPFVPLRIYPRNPGCQTPPLGVAPGGGGPEPTLTLMRRPGPVGPVPTRILDGRPPLFPPPAPPLSPALGERRCADFCAAMLMLARLERPLIPAALSDAPLRRCRSSSASRLLLATAACRRGCWMDGCEQENGECGVRTFCVGVGGEGEGSVRRE